MKEIKLLVFCIIGLSMYQCGPGILDYDNQISEYIFFSSDGSRKRLFIGTKYKDGISIDSVLIYPTITKIDYSDDYIIIEQSPNKNLIVSDFANDYCSPIYTEEKREKCFDFADSVINENAYFQNVFKQKTNYWIVRINDYLSYGPYDYAKFLTVKDSLKVNLEFDQQ